MARIAELIWKSDNRSVIRGLKEIADQSEKTDRQIRDNADTTSASFEKVRRSSGALRDSVANLAGLVGFGGLVFGIKDAIKGGEQLQTAQAQLRTALGGSKTAFDQLNAAAVRASTHGGFTTPENLQSLTSLVRETHSASEAQKLFALATNIARGRNIDLASAQMVVQRAYTGSIGRLQQLLGPMVAVKNAQFGLTQAHKQEILQLELESKSMGKNGALWLKQQEILRGITPQVAALATLQDKSATAQQVIAAAQTAFGGSTAAFSNTTAGRMSNLQHSLQNLTDVIGVKLLPIVNRMAGILLGVVNVFSKLPGPMQAAILGFTAFAALLPFIRGAGAAIGSLGRVAGITAGEESALGAASGRAAIEQGGAGLVGAEGGAAGLAAGGLRSGLLRGALAIGAGALGAATLRSLTGIGNRHGKSNALGSLIGTGVGGVGGFLLGGPLGAGIGAGLGNIVGGFLGSRGGVVPRYLAAGGPMGSDTVPAWLTPGEGVLSLQGMNALANLNAGGGAGMQQPIIVQVRLDGRVLTESVVRYSQSRAARGPTSFVGGSLNTGNALSFS